MDCAGAVVIRTNGPGTTDFGLKSEDGPPRVMGSAQLMAGN